MENASSNSGSARRKTLNTAVACLLTENGFESADKLALETLTEILQSFLTELGQSSKSYCELAGRTEPIIGDVVMGLIGMGISIEGIESYSRRSCRTVVQAQTACTQPKQPNILQAGVKQNLPQHIPDYLPQFPDPHAYIRTPTHKQPVTEYEAIREKSAVQKRDLERALTRFIAKAGEQQSLFLTPDNNHLFPLIPCKTGCPAYLNALLPKDQVFDFEELELSQSEYKKVKQSESVNEDRDRGKSNDEPVRNNEPETIDNPYLRPVKMPKKFK